MEDGRLFVQVFIRVLATVVSLKTGPVATERRLDAMSFPGLSAYHMVKHMVKTAEEKNTLKRKVPSHDNEETEDGED